MCNLLKKQSHQLELFHPERHRIRSERENVLGQIILLLVILLAILLQALT